MNSYLKSYYDSLYEEGKSPISDEVYDAIFGQSGQIGKAYGKTRQHLFQLYSLTKYFDEEEYPELKDPVITPKLDGVALALQFVGHKFVAAVMRGDGIEGTDVTEAVIEKGLVPNKVPDFGERFQIVGEVVLPIEFKNARNLVAGTLKAHLNKQENYQALLDRPITFVAYDCHTTESLTFYTDTLDKLRQAGYNTVDAVDSSSFPTDGEVYRENSYYTYYAKGFTEKAPRGAFARKKSSDVEILTSELKDIVWQVGRSGVVTPVAKFKPVQLDGANISSASLDNVGLLMESELRLNDKLYITRRGGIIPRIVSFEQGTGELVNVPELCPACSSKLAYQHGSSGTKLLCVNPQCPAKSEKRLVHFFTTLGVKGFGQAKATAIVNKYGDIGLDEVLQLDQKSLISLFGKNGEKISSQLEKLKVPLHTALAALGIPLIGLKAAKTIASEASKSSSSTLSEAISVSSLNGLGPESKASFKHHWSEEFKNVIDKIAYVPGESEKAMKIAITGKLPGLTKKEAVEALGAELVDNVADADYLIGSKESNSRKVQMAEKHRVPIVTYQYLLSLKTAS